MLETKNRRFAGRKTADVFVAALKPVPDDAEQWDVEFGDGTHAIDVYGNRNAPNAGLARAAGLRLVKQMLAEDETLLIDHIEVTTYDWVATSFEDLPQYGGQTILDAEKESRTKQYGRWDEQAKTITWSEPEPYRD